MSTPPDSEAQNRDKIAEFTQAIQALQRSTGLSDILADLDQVQALIRRVEASFEKFAGLGYAYLNALRQQYDQARAALASAEARVHADRQPAAIPLQDQVNRLLTLLSQASGAVADRPEFDRLASRLESEVRAAETSIQQALTTLRGYFRPAQEALEGLERYLSDVAWALEQVKESGAALESGESLVVACKAEWFTEDKRDDDPDGVLYLSDRRLMFEQDEKKGRLLGMFGGKQVQNLLWSVALDQIASIETERRGIIGGKAMMTLHLAPGAEHAALTVEIKGGFGNTRLEEMIQRVRQGDFGAPIVLPEADAAPASPSAVVPQAASAPTVRQPITRANVNQLIEIGTLGGPDSAEPYTHPIRRIVISADGSRLATLSEHKLYVWEVATATLLMQAEGAAEPLAISANGRLLAMGQGLECVIIAVDQAAVVQTLVADKRKFNAVAFSPDGAYLAASQGQPHQIVLYRTSDWSIAETLPIRYLCFSVAFSSSGRLLAYAGSQEINPMTSEYGYDLRVLDISTENVRTVRRYDTFDGPVIFSPDEAWLGTLLRVIHIGSGEQTEAKTLRGFSADNALYLSGENPPTWYACVGGQAIHSLPQHPAHISALAISPDATLVATAHGTWKETAHSGVRLWAVMGDAPAERSTPTLTLKKS